MKRSTIDGYDVSNWFKCGLSEVSVYKQAINSINVFPVADGDTGTNLTLTLKAMSETVETDKSFGVTIRRISKSGLSHARGNSGLIFATYFHGIAFEAGNCETVTPSEFALIAQNAVKYVYQAIENPVEGTMISVIREWADFLAFNHQRFDFFDDLFKEAYSIAQTSLAKTPEILEVLRKNNVVDSGAAGFVRFLNGINHFFNSAKEGKRDEGLYFGKKSVQEIHTSNYRYCVQLLLNQVKHEHENVKATLRAYGDSLIVASDNDKMKLHIHTNSLFEVIHNSFDFGNIIEQKIEDITRQQYLNSKSKGGIALVTDSIADISDEEFEKYTIHRIDLPIAIEEHIFRDKLTIHSEELFKMTEKNDFSVTSSQPEVLKIRELFEELFEYYDSVVVVSVAQKLSGTYAVLNSEASRLKAQGKKIDVIDSRLNSGAEGLLVQTAAQWIEEGQAHDDVVHNIKAIIPKIKIYVCIETLEYAVKSGRVPNTVGKIGIRLGARPIMTLNAEGKGAAFGCAFSAEALSKKIFKIIKKIHTQRGIVKYCIVHGNNLMRAQNYEAFMVKLTGKRAEFITPVSAITASYSGEGCVAVCVMENEKG